MSNFCNFEKAWIGKCKKITKSSKNSMCESHEKVLCAVCGKKAIKECSQTGGLVCGTPLCSNCECNMH